MLYCEDESKNINMKDKVSKILLKKNAIDELKEYDKMDLADKNAKYYLGKPSSCTPKNNKYNEESIKKCNNVRPNFTTPSNINYIGKHELLIMKDGGINLEDFTKKVLKKMNKTPSNNVFIEKFLIEFYKIFPGIKNLLEHNLIHYDLKPTNFVYNQDKNELNFIDFGLMTYYSNLRQSFQNPFHDAFFHWSYPIEIGYINKAVFDKCKNDKKYILQYMNNKRVNRKYVSTFIGYISRRQDNNEFKTRFNRDLNYMLNNRLPDYTYEDLLDGTLSTVDTYGAGLTLMYIIMHCKQLLDEELFVNLYEIAYGMIHPDLRSRSNVDTCINDYIKVLQSNGILSRNNAYFDSETLEIKFSNKKAFKTQI
jgi:serine/threonine protein kinase